MSLVYAQSDEPRKTDFNFNPHKFNGAEMFRRHYANMLYIVFVADNPLSTRLEKYQAEKELVVAKSKMKYWENITKQQGNLPRIREIMEEENKKWNK